MASEIKVDTISEKTSANGVSIDSVVHKDSAVYPSSADGGALGSASNEWSDLFLADSSVIKFGADQDTTLTHTDGTGLTLNSTNKLCFNDASQFIQGSSNAILALGATDEIDLTATAVDLNGTLDVSGTSLLTGRVGVVTAGDLGAGIHIRISDTSASVDNAADGLVIEDNGAVGGGLSILSATDNYGTIAFGDSGDNNIGKLSYNHSDDSMRLSAGASERVRIDSSGRVLIGNTATNLVAGNTAGIAFRTNESGTASVGGAQFSRDGGMAVAINRLSDDGALQVLYQAGSLEGTISVSGTTVAYGTFCGTHWSRLSDNSKPTILRGTVMESIATMMDWYQATSDVAESTDGEGNVTPAHQVKENVALPDGKSVGDSVTFTSGGEEYTGVYVKEDNEQLPMCKISNTADSKAVYGVFMAWDDTDDGNDGDVNDMYVASLGAFVVRVHSGETVAIGDYLQSKGDGTAKVQADDIMRASTIAKVTSTTKTITHGDGSYCVPCTLHCG